MRLLSITFIVSLVGLFWLNLAPPKHWTSNDIRLFDSIATPVCFEQDGCDMQWLAKAVGNSRIVCLGEAVHMDAGIQIAKSRIVQYLHQKLGFDVLLMETGMYDMWYMNQQWKQTDTLKPYLGMFPFWAYPEETESLWSYVQKHELALGGFDVQFSGEMTKEQRFDQLGTYLTSRGLDLGQFSDVAAYFKDVNMYDPFMEHMFKDTIRSVKLERAFAELSQSILPLRNHTDTVYHYYLQGLSKWFAATRLKRGGFERFEIRDSMMAERAISLIEGPYKGRKVVVWAANIHLLYNPQAADNAVFSSLGNHLKKRFSDSCYSICATFNQERNKEGDLYNSASSHSVENLLHQLGKGDVFIDCRQVPLQHPFRKDTLLSRIFTNSRVHGVWGQMMDGLLYIDKTKKLVYKRRLNELLETTGLGFSFGDLPILKQIDLCVPQGSIYAYLGKNGAGKTTTIRLLLGLLQPSSGTIHYQGSPLKSQLPQLFYRIGNMIENPCLYDHLTCQGNLEQMNILFKRGRKRIDECLELVGLSDARKRKASQLSTGMRQRLGLAIALYHQPEFLILDEPTNGLDPVGVIDVRKLLLQLNAEGVSILISSHILSEVERICTHVGILHQGQLLFQGTKDELMKQAKQHLLLSCSDPAKALELCVRMQLQASSHSEGLRIAIEEPHQLNQLMRELVGNEVIIHQVNQERESMESLFVKYISK